MWGPLVNQCSCRYKQQQQHLGVVRGRLVQKSTPRDNPGLYFAFRVQVYLDLIILSVEINCKGKLEAVRARPGVFEDDSSKGCEPNDRFPVILFSRLLCRASKKEYQYLWPSGRGKAP